MFQLMATAGSSLLLAIAIAFPSCQAQPVAPPAPPPNGPPTSPAFFPLAVWWQQANGTGHSGPYPTNAAAAAAAHMNIMLGQGADWPEQFGADQGELAAIKQNGLYVVGGINVPWNQNTSNLSVASILALAQSQGAQANLIGYNAGDEPQCQPGQGQIAMQDVPQVIAGIHSYDPTRLVTLNQTDWMIQPQWQHNPSECLAWDEAALQATGVASMDYYPVTSPYARADLGVGGSNYSTVPNDSLFMQGLSVRALAHFAAAGQPVWAYVESGSDNFGLSSAQDNMPASVTAGSTTLVATGPQQFGSAWIGLGVQGSDLPSGAKIVAVQDAKHATLSAPATGSNGNETITVAGGVNNADCVASTNVCVVNGNEYRPTAAQVAAEVWMSVIAGANGIEWFCHDSTSYSFCLGDSALGGSAATAVFDNIQYVDRTVLHHAPILNAPSVGGCSMDQLDYSSGTLSTARSCSGGDLTIATDNPAVPGAALLKAYNGADYLIAQSMRRGNGGARLTFTVPQMANRHATIVYDTNERYDPSHATNRTAFALDGAGSFTDAIGTYDDYQVKIYRLR